MIGQDQSGAVKRVLKISRLEPSELNIIEDSTTYSEADCCELRKRLHDGNLSTGGLEFVTLCYGIVGKSLTSNEVSPVLILFLEVILLRIRTYSLIIDFRVFKVSGTLLHASYHEEEEDWCNLWSFYICHC